MGISRTYRSRESGNTTQKRSPPPPPPPPTSSVNLPLETVTNQITVEELPKRRASCSNLHCKEQLNHQNKCSEALIVLLNYLINDVSNARSYCDSGNCACGLRKAFVWYCIVQNLCTCLKMFSPFFVYTYMYIHFWVCLFPPFSFSVHVCVVRLSLSFSLCERVYICLFLSSLFYPVCLMWFAMLIYLCLLFWQTNVWIFHSKYPFISNTNLKSVFIESLS